MRTKKVNFQSARFKLAGEINLPNNFQGKLPTVILFHGLTNSRKDCPLIDTVSKALVKNGIIAFRFDFFGSGESQGEMREKRFDILEQNAKDAITFISDQPFVNRFRLGLWGRSFGGTFASLIPPNKNIKARVIASPGTIIEKTIMDKWKRLKKKERELQKIGKKLAGTGKYKGAYELDVGWFTSLRGVDKRITDNLKKIKTVLVLGTANDEKVTLNDICTAANLVKEPKKIVIYNTGHDYSGYESEAVKETINWFRKYL